jgi:hypothetical protein
MAEDLSEINDIPEDDDEIVEPPKDEDELEVPDKPNGTQNKKGEEEEDPLDDDEQEIPVRRSALQHIIARKNRKIERLEARQPQAPPNPSFNDDGADEDAEDDIELTPVTRKLIHKEAMQAAQPLLDAAAKQSDDQELNDLFGSEPAAKKVEKTIRKYMEHPAWQHVPVAAIYHHIAFNSAQQDGAHRRQVADRGARQSGAPGRQPVRSLKDPSELDLETLQGMSDAGISKLKERAMRS